MTPADRARRYVAQLPNAVSGQGGHNSTFKVAIALIHGFALDDPTALQVLLEYNQRCEPPWTEAELRHKLADAGKRTRHKEPKGHLLFGRGSKTKLPAVVPQGVRVVWSLKVEPLLGEQTPPIEPKAQTATEDPGDEYLREMKRMAGEMAKIYTTGALSGPDDPSTPIVAAMIHIFLATYVEDFGTDPQSPPSCQPANSTAHN